MPMHAASSPLNQPAKRQRQSSIEAVSPRHSPPSPSGNPGDVSSLAGAGSGRAGQSSNFRNVSACNRCRNRKNRCDQKLPSCASCAKAGVACVGYDPITKKEIPRSYVFYLETRLKQLEKLLEANNIKYPPADNLELCSRQDAQTNATLSDADQSYPAQEEGADSGSAKPENQTVRNLKSHKHGQDPTLLNIVSPSKPKSLASASGVSFARVVLAAVQFSVSDQAAGANAAAGSRHPSGSGTSMRDSFFGLHTKPTIKPAAWPDRDVANRLVTLYFEHANPQIPILHRGEFMTMFEQAYSSDEPRSARDLYMLNMVFAIGCGVIVGEPVKTEASNDPKMALDFPANQAQPEEYHASAIVHLESCLSNSGGGLEVLQAVLLLANFALLRPVPPGLWYIIGVAARLAVDLGLHHEDGSDVDGGIPGQVAELDQSDVEGRRGSGPQERGRRQWIRDMRRRLWWCTYSFDRLVSTCVGRPFGISDQVITTDLPSLLDDDYITPDGILEGSEHYDQPSYKHVAHHYFRLRMLQSEILQVLQYNQAQRERAGTQPQYPEMHTHLQCPFLVNFENFRLWRLDIDDRLRHWKDTAPTKYETGVAFSTEFLELNYWQAIVLLYRQSLSVPAMFEDEYNTSNEVNSPTAYQAELREDEEKIYIKVAEAGQKILRIYRQLHLSGLVSYTYLSTHHLFMAGISYLYAIWNSPAVREGLTLDEVDLTILAARSVFTDMIDKCPPAETCRDAFDRTARATIKMASSNGGFGPQAQALRRPRRAYTSSGAERSVPDGGAGQQMPKRPHVRSRNAASEQQAFSNFDITRSDTTSSPGMASGDLQHSPPLSKGATFDSEGYMSRGGPPRSIGPASSDGTVSQGRMDQGIGASPPVVNRIVPGGPSAQQQQHSPAPNAFMGQQFGLQGSMDLPDAPTREFLQNLGMGSNGDFSSVDQNQMDLGFGLNWEGLGNDYGDSQTVNPFDSFFFGPPQGGGQGAGGAGGAGANGDGTMGGM